MSIKQYFTNTFLNILPPTRLYSFKNRILNLVGYSIHPSARIVSSIQIWGEIKLSIGQDTFIGHDCFISGSDAVINIKDYVDIGPRVSIIAGTHEIDMIGPHSAGSGTSKDIVIGEGVWIGAGCLIVGGVEIGKKAIIGAGSNVVHNIPPNTIAVGNPCRPIKCWNPQINQWEPINK
jgi:maltose O-acetyltransferase